MRLGIGSFAFRWSIGIGPCRPTRPMTPAELVETARELGADFVQIADNLPLHAQPPTAIVALEAALGRTGIGVELGCDAANDTMLETYLALAERLGAPIIRLLLNKDDLALPRAELASRLRRHGDVAARQGTRLGIENHFLLPSPELAAFIRHVDHDAVGVCLDLANSIAVGEWTEVTVDILAPHTVSLHLKDYRFEIDPQGCGFKAVGVPLGDGRVDLIRAVAKVAAVAPTVDAVVEHWLPRVLVEDAEPRALERDWTAASLAYLREHLAAGG